MLQQTLTVVLLYAALSAITQGIAEEFSQISPTDRAGMPPAFWDLSTDQSVRNVPELILHARAEQKKEMASAERTLGIEKNVKIPDSSDAASQLRAKDSLESTGSRRNPVYTLEIAPVIKYAEKSHSDSLLTLDGGDSIDNELGNRKIFLDPHDDLRSTLDTKAEEDSRRRVEVSLSSASGPVAAMLRDAGLRRQKRDGGERNAVEGRRYFGRVLDVRGRYRPPPPNRH